jgi:hypothetical protein
LDTPLKSAPPALWAAPRGKLFPGSTPLAPIAFIYAPTMDDVASIALHCNVAD